MTLDAHQHFWQYDPERHAWIDDSMAAIRRDFLPGTLEPHLSAHGIDGCVAVQADQTTAENDFLLGLARDHAFIRGVVGWVDLADTAVEAQLDRYAGEERFVGVRHVVQAEGPGFLDRKDFRAGLKLLREYGLTYDILIYHHQLQESTRLVTDFPDLLFVVDHIAKPVIAGQPDEEWVNHLRSLARHENVYCKLSGMVTEVPTGDWTPQLLQPYVETVLEAFGTDRVMYGSDWPVCLTVADYTGQLEALRYTCAELSGDEQAALFGGNTARFYGLPASQ